MTFVPRRPPRINDRFRPCRPTPLRRALHRIEPALRAALRIGWAACAGSAIAGLAIGCGRLGFERRVVLPDAGLADASVEPDGGGGGAIDAGLDAGSVMPALATIAVDSSYESTCAVREDGAVLCWGANARCQTGEDSSGAPVPAPRLAIAGGAAAVWSGGTFTCVSMRTGEVACFGGNTYFALGPDGPSGGSCDPVVIPGAASATTVAPGQDHACALLASGDVRCWGRNSRGQLGDGTTTNRRAPVLAMTGATALSAGFDFTCAIGRDGQAWCWGEDGEGQLGAGSSRSADHETRPVAVVELGNAVRLAAGEAHACALRRNGDVTCWGRNNRGQLGVTGPAPVGYPGPALAGLSGVVDLAAGEEHTCALLDTGEVRCWGAGTWGQMGDGLLVDQTPSGVNAIGIDDAIAITAGEHHVCALGGSGELDCWGWNGERQLGLGVESNGPFSTPTPVAAPPGPP